MGMGTWGKEIEKAYERWPGAPAVDGELVFARALLASGQNSTLTGTLAGRL